MIILEIIAEFFIQFIFEGIILTFAGWIGRGWNKLDDFLFKRKK